MPASPAGALGALVEDLRRPLLLAARDGFAGLETAGAGLGPALRAACDRLVRAKLPPERVGPVTAWRRALERFERLPRMQQEVEVARGLRLCQALAGPAPAGAMAAARAAAVATTTAVATTAPASPPVSPLDLPVTALSGIGPALAEHLRARSLETLEDLIWLVPRRYDDLRQVVPLAEALAASGPEADVERVTLVAEVVSVSFSRWRRRFLTVKLRDGDAALTARWFQVPAGMAKRFEKGRRVVLSGKLRWRVPEAGGAAVAEMANPEVIGDAPESGEAPGGGIRPRYALVEGVAPAILRKACRAAVARAGDAVEDGVPAPVAARLGLPPLGEALRRLHDPPANLDEAAVAALDRGESDEHRRLAFDELFFLGLAVARRRAERVGDRAPACAAPGLLAQVRDIVHFSLTGAQARVIEEIATDLAGERPMGRLLQGDVGAGKTAVAFAAALAALGAGRQFALMAPTEILAEQHMRTLQPWLSAAGFRAALLTASTPRGVRESTLSMLAAGAVGGLIGTHALLAARVDFADLGVAIVDEQHRFGVAQRARLRAKGEALPHLLVMTATPIPRTLALTAYGDLDVSLLDERPPGREPPKTEVLLGEPGRRKAEERLAKAIAAGGRAFVVCALIDGEGRDPNAPPAETAVAMHARLAERLAPARVGLVHGRMAQPERDEALSGLARGDLDVLVSTTVIEVGVDVPEATLMVIHDADRFGLAQLHQLRGRVGRGGGASACLLVSRAGRSSDAAARLRVLAETDDGFRIAEEDLRLRGPGEVFGARQAGLPKLRFGDLAAHGELLRQARAEADALLAADPALGRPEHAACARVLAARTRGPIYGGEAG